MKAIKNILKKILPTPFLKEAFLFYNKVKISTVDKVLFPEYKIQTSEFLIYRKGFPFREAQININDLPENEVKSYMQTWKDWTQEEFILEFKKTCWIEPDYGWGIVKRNKLVYYSLGVSRTWFQNKPNFVKFLTKKDVMHITQAISLRDSGEENYFHFYNDVLGKLFFLQQHNISVKTIPVIISKKLWDKEYFRFYFKNSAFLQSLQWIVQDQQYIQTDSIFFAKPLTHRKDLWDEIISPFVSQRNIPQSRKIFLTRSKSRLRFIENDKEIEAICRKLEFTIIDTDNLPLEQQVEVFSGTGFLVGIHGAGLTNMVFRHGECRVLELFPPPDAGYLPYHYIMLAKMLHFQYRATIGAPGKVAYSGGFYLEPGKFEKGLLDFLDTASHPDPQVV